MLEDVLFFEQIKRSKHRPQRIKYETKKTSKKGQKKTHGTQSLRSVPPGPNMSGIPNLQLSLIKKQMDLKGGIV